MFVYSARLTWFAQALVDQRPASPFPRRPWSYLPGETFDNWFSSIVMSRSFCVVHACVCVCVCLYVESLLGMYLWKTGSCHPWELPHGWHLFLFCQCCQEVPYFGTFGIQYLDRIWCHERNYFKFSSTKFCFQKCISSATPLTIKATDGRAHSDQP